MALHSDGAVIPLRHGPVLPVSVIRRLCDMADAGLVVRLQPDGKVFVGPRGRVQPADIQFIREHRDQVVAALRYLEHGVACTCADLGQRPCPWHGVEP